VSRLSDYDRYDALGLAELIRRREVAAAEVLEEAIARTEAVNDRLNAIVIKDYAAARRRAGEALPDSPLAGVPFLIKDITYQRGLPCTFGSRLYADHVVDHDAEIVARYRAALGSVAGIGFQRVDPRDRSTHKDFAILCADTAQRNRIEAALTAEQIQTKRYFRPAHAMRAYRRWATRPLPRTDDVYERILCLPIFNELLDADVDRIADLVRMHAGR